MARDYRRLTGIGSAQWRRIVVFGFVVLVALAGGLRLLRPTAVLLQEAAAPDGHCMARLYRLHDVQRHVVVKTRSGWLWHTAYFSDPITNAADFADARLDWSADGRALDLLLSGQRTRVYTSKASGGW